MMDGSSNVRSLSSMRNRVERTNLVLNKMGDGVVNREDLMRSCSEAGMDPKEFELILELLIEQRVIFEPRNFKLSRVK